MKTMQRIGLFLLFLTCGLLVFVVFSHYFPIFKRPADSIGRIVVVGEDGSIASFCTIWFDDVKRTACFEPVATVPTHQRRGLARAMMVEGMHRLKHVGCKVAFVSGSSKAANALYSSVMGGEHDIYELWEKIVVG